MESLPEVAEMRLWVGGRGGKERGWWHLLFVSTRKSRMNWATRMNEGYGKKQSMIYL
jgi:hypothetical protein